MGHFRWDISGGSLQVGFWWVTSGGTLQVGHFRWDTSGGSLLVEHFRWVTSANISCLMLLFSGETLLETAHVLCTGTLQVCHFCKHLVFHAFVSR